MKNTIISALNFYILKTNLSKIASKEVEILFFWKLFSKKKSCATATPVVWSHNFSHSNFHVSFCLLVFVKCLFYWCGCLIYFGRSLFYFGGCLFYFGSCLIYFDKRLIYFSGCLFYFGGCHIYFSGCFIYLRIRLMQFYTSLIYFGRCLYFFEFNFRNCFVLNWITIKDCK